MVCAIQQARGENVGLDHVNKVEGDKSRCLRPRSTGYLLKVVKLLKPKRGILLLSRRWAAECDFASFSRSWRLVEDYECLPQTVTGQRFVAFACLFLHRAVTMLKLSP